MTQRREMRAIVTGATAGLGRATAGTLAAVGMSVTLAVRDVEKGARTAAEITAEQSSADITVTRIDLADLDSVRSAARGIRDAGPVDLLVNNAGLSVSGTRRTTAQGYELHMGVNHLGHFALTAELMPALLAAEHPRVVSLSSIAHRMTGRLDPRLGSGADYSAWKAYAQSKLACGLFGLELDRRARTAGIDLTSLVAHPGWSATQLFTHTGTDRQRGLHRLFKSTEVALASSPAQGVQSQLRAALDPSLRGGELIGPRWVLWGPPRVEKPAGNMRDLNSARILWELSEERTGTRLDLAAR